MCSVPLINNAVPENRGPVPSPVIESFAPARPANEKGVYTLRPFNYPLIRFYLSRQLYSPAGNAPFKAAASLLRRRAALSSSRPDPRDAVTVATIKYLRAAARGLINFRATSRRGLFMRADALAPITKLCEGTRVDPPDDAFKFRGGGERASESGFPVDGAGSPFFFATLPPPCRYTSTLT